MPRQNSFEEDPHRKGIFPVPIALGTETPRGYVTPLGNTFGAGISDITTQSVYFTTSMDTPPCRSNCKPRDQSVVSENNHEHVHFLHGIINMSIFRTGSEQS